MSRDHVRAYDREFKLNAVQLYHSSGRGYKKTSSELGIPISTLVHWVQDHKKNGQESFPGKGYLKPSEAEYAQLRKELAVTREERDILKKALGIFSAARK